MGYVPFTLVQEIRFAFEKQKFFSCSLTFTYLNITMSNMAQNNDPMVDSESERQLLETTLQTEDTDIEDETTEQLMNICSRETAGEIQINKKVNSGDTEQFLDSQMSNFEELEIKKSLSTITDENLSMNTEDLPNGQQLINTRAGDEERLSLQTELQSQLQDVSKNLNTEFFQGNK